MSKPTTATKTLAALDCLIATETANLATWRRNGIPTAQKELEIGRLVLRRAEVAKR